MARTAPFSIRVEPGIKEALDAAALAEERSLSWLVERIVKDWLTDNGFLNKDGTARKVRQKRES